MKGFFRKKKKSTTKQEAVQMTITAGKAADSSKFEALLYAAFDVLEFIEMQASEKGVRVSSVVMTYKGLLEEFKREMIDKADDKKKADIDQIVDLIYEWKKKEGLSSLDDTQLFLLLNSANTIMFGRMKPVYRAWRKFNIESKARNLPAKRRSKYIHTKMESYNSVLVRMTNILNRLSVRNDKADAHRNSLIAYLDSEIKVELTN